MTDEPAPPTAAAASWRHARGSLDLSRPVVMGIVNVTPDSFSDGGAAFDPGAARDRGLALLEQGADVLDIGGESTRPGAAPVDADEERRRILPVVEALADCGAPLSIDTTKALVARAALDAGAAIINDVSALGDPEMLALAIERGAGLALMHMQGEPRTMQADPSYEDVVDEVLTFLLARATAAEASGLPAACIALDPGIGFGKTLDHNLELLRATPRFAACGYPLLIGTSRKSMIKQGLERVAARTPAPAEAAGGYPRAPQDEPSERAWGTAATVAHAVAAGAQIIRVHDVRAMRQVADLALLLRPRRAVRG